MKSGRLCASMAAIFLSGTFCCHVSVAATSCGEIEPPATRGPDTLQDRKLSQSADVSWFAASVDGVRLLVWPARGLACIFEPGTSIPQRSLELRDRSGRDLHFVDAIDLPWRRSMLLQFWEPVVWEIFLGRDAPLVHEGLVHDFRMGEGIAEPARFPVRRWEVDFPARLMGPVPGRPEVLVVGDAPAGGSMLALVNLDIRRSVDRITWPPPAANIRFWCREDDRVVELAGPKNAGAWWQIPGLLPLPALPAGYVSCEPKGDVNRSR